MADEQVQQEQSPQEQLPGLLGQLPGAPAKEQLDLWKAEFGEVFVSGFSETELYVWRPIRRPEYIKMQELMANPEAQMDEFKVQEYICNVCILWKSSKRGWAEGKAGTPQTLAEQIMQNSNFLSPAAASMLVAKL